MPMHLLGVSGMPRRVLDYPSFFMEWNQVSTLGFFLTFISLFWFMAATSPVIEFCVLRLVNFLMLYLNRLIMYLKSLFFY